MHIEFDFSIEPHAQSYWTRPLEVYLAWMDTLDLVSLSPTRRNGTGEKQIHELAHKMARAKPGGELV